jgi:hypothetical protein
MSIVNVTTLSLGNADRALPKHAEVKYVQMTRTFKVNTPTGVKVGHPGDYLIERANGDRDCIVQIEFESIFTNADGSEISAELEERVMTSSQAELELSPCEEGDQNG